MGEDFVQPHQRAIEVHLNPARCACYILTMTPTFYKAHVNGTHLDKVEDMIKSIVDTLGKEFSKFLIVEDLESTAWWNFTHSSWMKSMEVIAVTAMDKYGPITDALGKHLTPYVQKHDTPSDLMTNILNGRVTVYVELVSEEELNLNGIHHDLGTCHIECFSYPLVQFMVGHRTPVVSLLVINRG